MLGVIDVAKANKIPVSPKIKLCIAGVVVGAVGSFWYYYTDDL
jgi:hypothetical protein